MLGGMLLALIPGLSGRGCLWIRQPWTRATSDLDLAQLGSKSRMGHIPQRPRLPSYWAWMCPQGQAGLRAGKTGLPAPPVHTSLEFEDSGEGVTGTGGSLHSTLTGLGGELGRREGRGST